MGWGKVETRLDCTYFRARRRFDRLKFGETERLGRLLKGFFSGGTPLTTNEEFWAGDLPWASPKDFDGSFYISDTVDHISTSALIGSAAKKAEADTVLMVVRSGVLAHSLPVAVTTQAMAINQDLKAMVPHGRLRADYLAAFLSIFADDILPIVTKHGVTVQSVNSPELLALPVPVPDLSVQESIASMLIAAHQQRDARFAEAAALLASIDDYLLSELGITLPPETENTLANRTFRVSAHELGGWRFDPPVHQSKFSLESAKFDSVPLGRICHINPRPSFGGLHDNDLAGFIPMDAISDRLGIVEYVGERRIEECVGYTTFRDYDVLWAKITPCMENGKSAVVHDLTNGVGFGSTEFHVIRPRSAGVLPEYVHALLRMGRLRREAKRFFTGSSGHRRVDEDFLKKLIVPVPPVETQERLVQEIRARREQAIEAQNAAAAELEVAKRKIEAVLLGDAA